MIKINKAEVYGWEAAIRGMRNSWNSWEKSDTKYPAMFESDTVIGENDLALMKKLCAAGSSHRKFLRFIAVTCDITAPLYWWKEMDTYKVGTVANSTSTMHTIDAKPFEIDDFSHDHLLPKSAQTLQVLLNILNTWRKDYLDLKNKTYWWQIIQLLPSSYNQKRTVLLNYEVLSNMYFQRKAHKLDEWRDFCKLVEDLPYFKQIVLEKGKY